MLDDSEANFELTPERAAIREHALSVRDLIINPWSEESGGITAQIAFWRGVFREHEVYSSEEEEAFEQYVADNNLDEV